MKENYQESLTGSELADVYAKIKEYNARFSLGALAGRSMFRQVLKETDVGSDLPTVEEMKATIDPSLVKAGLELVSVDPRQGAVMDPEGTQTAQEVRTNIDDSEKFLAFLSTLPDEGLDQETLEALQYISEKLVLQLFENYDFQDDEDDAMLNLAGNIRRIHDQIGRLAENAPLLGEVNEKISNTIPALEGEYLREYVLIKGEYPDPPNFWVWGDTMTEVFGPKFQTAIDHLAEVGENPKASELYQEFFNQIETSVNEADNALTEEFAKEEPMSHLLREKENWLALMEECKETLNKKRPKE